MNCFVMILFLLLWNTCKVLLLDKQQKSSSCYLTNPTTHRKIAWQLVWEDSFDSANSTEHDWNITHESVTCSGREFRGYILACLREYSLYFPTGNNIKQVSCNVMHNVRVQESALALVAQHEKHYTYHYTAATISTKKVRFYSNSILTLTLILTFPPNRHSPTVDGNSVWLNQWANHCEHQF